MRVFGIVGIILGVILWIIIIGNAIVTGKHMYNYSSYPIFGKGSFKKKIPYIFLYLLFICIFILPFVLEK